MRIGFDFIRRRRLLGEEVKPELDWSWMYESEPIDPEDYRADMALYVDDVKQQKREKRQHIEYNACAYALLLQHCPPAEEATLKADGRWEAAKAARSGIMLAQMIRDASHDTVEHKNPYVTCVEGIIGVFTHTQDPGQPLDDYQTRFQAKLDQVRAHQGQPWRHLKLIEHERKWQENEGKEDSELAEIADEGFLATLFIIFMK